MARPVKGRLLLTGDLEIQSPLHVGGLEINGSVDLPLARNGCGKYYVPGTSLAGTFRAWFGQAFDIHQVTNWMWGDDNGASHVIVHDAVVKDGYVDVEIRDGVSIDRRWGTAAKRMKYEFEILPKGTCFSFMLECDYNSESETFVKNGIAYFIDSLQHKEVFLGANRSKGFGQVKLINKELYDADFSTAEGLLSYIERDRKGVLVSNLSTWKTLEPKHKPTISFKIDWRPKDSVMVKSGYEGAIIDILPLVSGIGAEQVSLVIPGSSWKGALRSRAESIMRTILDEPSLPEDDTQPSLRQIQLPLVNELFGMGFVQETEAVKDRVGMASLRIEECYGETSFEKGQWDAFILGMDEDNELSTIKDQFLHSYHVAVDRWTSGAAQGMLFSRLEPKGASFDALCMTLDFERIADERAEPAVALLLLLLRELIEGNIKIGYGTNGGYGGIEVSQIELTIAGEIENLEAGTYILSQDQLKTGDLSVLSALFSQLSGSWHEFIVSYNQEEGKV